MNWNSRGVIRCYELKKNVFFLSCKGSNLQVFIKREKGNGQIKWKIASIL